METNSNYYLWTFISTLRSVFVAVLLKTTRVASLLSNVCCRVVHYSCGSNLWPLNCDWPLAHRGETFETFREVENKHVCCKRRRAASGSRLGHRQITAGSEGTSLSVRKRHSAALGKQTEPFPLRLSQYFLIHPPLMGNMTRLAQASSSTRTLWDHLTTYGGISSC